MPFAKEHLIVARSRPTDQPWVTILIEVRVRIVAGVQLWL